MSDGLEWQVCPVCGGRGYVPHNFYTGYGLATGVAPVVCRTCAGKTVLPRPTEKGADRA